MDRDTIIDLADSLTERKGKQLFSGDLKKLYNFVITNICRRSRFWWRKRLALFNLQVNKTTYDLTTYNTGLSPANAFTEIGIEEITRVFIVINAGTVPPQVQELNPIFDDMAVLQMNLGTQQGPPGQYLMDYNDFKTLRIDPPDAAYQLGINFWGMPTFPVDSANKSVPLIPPWYHDVIVQGMAAEIFSVAYGPQDIKTKGRMEKFEEGILEMQMRPKFTANVNQQLISEDAALSSTPSVIGVSQ